MARDAGAKRVIMASCAPPIRYPNVYGIDMPSRQELVAHGRTEDEIAQAIGADMVIFQTLPDLVESCRKFNTSIETFDCSVFTGEYVTGGVDEEYLQHIQSLREDSAMSKKAALIHNHSPSKPLTNGESPRKAVNGTIAHGEEAMDQHLENKKEDDLLFEVGCSGPMNGSDAVGLYNEPNLKRRPSGSRKHDDGQHDTMIGLSNSFYAGLATMDVNDNGPADLGVSEGANSVAGGAGAASNVAQSQSR